MKIDLTTSESKRQITSVRGQIKDSTSLKNFDAFVSKNSTFDFTNDEHLKAVKEPKNCHCDVTLAPVIHETSQTLKCNRPVLYFF
jgi:hypothetical protein